MRIVFEVDDLGPIEAMEGMQERAADLRPPFSLMVDDFHRAEAVAFATGGTSVPWEPDSAAWRARKAREGKSVRTLVFTSTLEKSLTHEGARYSVTRRGLQELVVGTKDPVVNLLAGASGRRKKLERRGDLLAVDARLRSRWGGWIGDHIMGRLAGGAGVFG